MVVVVVVVVGVGASSRGGWVMGVGFVDIATVDEDEVRLRKSGSCAISFNFVPEHYGNISAVQTLAENTSKKGSFFSFSFVFLRAPSSWEASEMCFFQLGTCYTRTESRGSKPQLPHPARLVAHGPLLRLNAFE